MAVTGTILPKKYANVITQHEQKEFFCHMQHLLEINKNKQKTEIVFVSNIVSIVTSPSRKQIKMKLMQFWIYFNIADQVHIFKKKSFYKTWTFDRSSQK